MTNASKGRDNRGDLIVLDATYAALYNDSTLAHRPTWRQVAICSGAQALQMINDGDPTRLHFERI